MAVERAPSGESLMSQRLAEARQLRSMLLQVVGGLAAAGLVPAAKYESIARGRGLRDMAEDCVALAQIFHEGEAELAGKHPIAPEVVERAATVGSWLLEQLRPAKARAEKEETPEATEIRNRFATLLANRYVKLQAIAHYFEGDDWEEVVPPLMRRQVTTVRVGAETPPPSSRMS